MAHQAVAAFRDPGARRPGPAARARPGRRPRRLRQTSGPPSATAIRRHRPTWRATSTTTSARPWQARLTAGTRVFAYVVDGCDGVRPLLVVDPTALRVPACAGGVPHLAVFAVPDRLVPPGARPA